MQHFLGSEMPPSPFPLQSSFGSSSILVSTSSPYNSLAWFVWFTFTFYPPVICSPTFLYSWAWEKFEWEQTRAFGFESTTPTKPELILTQKLSHFLKFSSSIIITKERVQKPQSRLFAVMGGGGVPPFAVIFFRYLFSRPLAVMGGRGVPPFAMIKKSV